MRKPSNALTGREGGSGLEHCNSLLMRVGSGAEDVWSLDGSDFSETLTPQRVSLAKTYLHTRDVFVYSQGP